MSVYRNKFSSVQQRDLDQLSQLFDTGVKVKPEVHWLAGCLVEKILGSHAKLLRASGA